MEARGGDLAAPSRRKSTGIPPDLGLGSLQRVRGKSVDPRPPERPSRGQGGLRGASRRRGVLTPMKPPEPVIRILVPGLGSAMLFVCVFFSRPLVSLVCGSRRPVLSETNVASCKKKSLSPSVTLVLVCSAKWHWLNG